MAVETESFEITDYDLENEFNPNRPQRRQSKNDQIYGIWAERGSDSDSEERHYGLGNKKSRKNYTAPISFLSGGVKTDPKKTEHEEAEVDAEESEEKVEEDPLLITGFGQRKKRQPEEVTREVDPRFGHLRRTDKEFGTWEQHTKGIGQKLLSKMGYRKGQGLGKANQGIIKPVEAIKRKGRGAVGAYGTETTDKRKIQLEGDLKEEGEQLQQWRKSTDKVNRKPKYVYKTVDQVMKAAGKKPSIDSAQLGKVIDMTRKEQRVFSDYTGIGKRHDRPDSDNEQQLKDTAIHAEYELPELLHNLDILCEKSEQELVANRRQLEHCKDIIVNLHHEEENLAQLVEPGADRLTKANEVMEILEHFQERHKVGLLSLDDCLLTFTLFQSKYLQEYQDFELHYLVPAIVISLVKDHFAHWNPLINPGYGMALIQSWKNVLDGLPRTQSQQDVMDPYHRLVWETWIPKLRQAILVWNVKECNPLIELMEQWLPLLPMWITVNIMDQLIVPRIENEVNNWDPTTDIVPIHAWIHPWLPLLGKRLEIVYPTIRHKLGAALKSWHPSDPSAKLIIGPWKKVFSRGSLDSFLVQSVVPKLTKCISEIVIDPHNQDMDRWTWISLWEDMITPCVYGEMLARFFFPKWLVALCKWLTGKPNFTEVNEWFLFWKKKIPDSLKEQPVIKDAFRKALEMMNRVASGLPPSVSSPAPAAPPSLPAVNISTYSNTSMNFKDLVQRKAEEHNILFIPIVNKTYQAMQIYSFGEKQVYINKGVIFSQQGTNQLWMPISLQSLIDSQTVGLV